MKVAIFGGTGFLGSYIIDELIKQEYYISIFARKNKYSAIATKSLYAKIIYGDINNNNDLENIIKEVEIVIYNIGIIKEVDNINTFKNLHFDVAKNCIDISIKYKIKKFILISANGVCIDGTSYQRSKFLAEEYLKKTSLKYTIFRPSVIFGEPKNTTSNDFSTILLTTLVKSPFPVVSFFTGFKFYNAGHFELAPIFVKDVAIAVVSCIKLDISKNNTYCMCGKNLTFNEIISIIADTVHSKKVIIPIPVFFAKFLALIFAKFSFFSVSVDEITMLVQGNICTSNKEEEEDIFEVLNISKKTFNATNLDYLNF